MTKQYDYNYGRRSSGAGTLLGIVFALLLGAAALGFFVHGARAGLAGRMASLITGRPMTMVSAPDVVDRIQRLSRLETVVYSLDTVVESKETSPLLPDVLGGDRLLMIVHGQTVAGVDLHQLKPESVQITEAREGRSIKLTLPPSQVFLTTIDNGRTRVYSRDTGLFVRADPNLETETRNRAQAELQSAALTDGILDAASRNARDTVKAVLGGLGFAHVDVQ